MVVGLRSVMKHVTWRVLLIMISMVRGLCQPIILRDINWLKQTEDAIFEDSTQVGQILILNSNASKKVISETAT